jgi:fumarate reductase subunit C
VSRARAGAPPGGAYRTRTPIFWWTHRWIHFRFILRELTSLCVAYATVLTIYFVRGILLGPAYYAEFLARMARPGWLVFHVVVLGGLLFHSITWFHLAPRAMVVKLGGRRVPGGAILLGNYLGWAAVSLVVVLLFFAR